MITAWQVFEASDIVMEIVVFKCLFLKDYRLQNSKWFLEPDYVPHKVTVGIKYINFENVVEFVLTRQQYSLVHCNSVGDSSS